jgi:predicted nucleic acid-binding protein
MNYADSNWLVAVYIKPKADDAEGVKRERIAERFTRRQNERLALSAVTALECENVFRRITKETQPEELAALKADFDGLLFVSPMDWRALMAECERLFARHAARLKLGTFDCAIVASAKLARAKRFLSFDARAAALATAEGLAVFPELDAIGRECLARLRA